MFNQRPLPSGLSLRRTHVVFKTHLDLGFTDLAAAVARRYRDEFIPQAIALAEALRAENGPDRFLWTTGSWLVHQAIEHGTPAQRRRIEAAVDAGDLLWHALPCTTHTELMDAELFRFGLGIARRLDARFVRKTVAAKMTDVPGHTRATVPLLAGGGIEFLHLGVNGACPLPEVPPVFRWRDAASGAEIVVAYADGYGGLTTVPGCGEALYFAHTGDNNGPPTAAEIHATFADLRAHFPGTAVEASTLDAFAAALRPARGQLPVVTSEIGDTWIHGVGSDPAKTAQLRALLRWRAGLPDPLAPELDGLNENLLLAAEHTWGLDTKTAAFGFLGPDYDREFRTEEFRRRRERPDYRRLEASWVEQRAYLPAAVASLPTAELRAGANAALAHLRPHPLPTGAPSRPARRWIWDISGSRWTRNRVPCAS